ncbi:hypothetical protein ANCDUO_00330 [Ancylostoma duodenale]|uniref:Arginase domain protein n=1 Tax=Ancylostoma duodenale TaxID=51022 RepID=A0A0C2H645_9BILA|nr:hypothetical protein ANCDUO_00330 [Ancylostoma duodenale]
MKRTMRLAQQFITAVGCANGNGGRHLGCEHAVKILRNSKFLKQVRVPIQWKHVVEEITTGRHFEALAGVTQTCKELAFHTRNAIENKEELLVLGGDHSCAMGTWSGVASAIRPYGDLGLIWVDAHMTHLHDGFQRC